MITKLYARGLKGLSFEENLGVRSVFTGRVGAGKSARGQAIWLLATGSVPHVKGGKKADEVLDSFGDGESLSVGAEIDGQTFERTFKRTKGGSVSQYLFLNGKKVPKAAFDATMLHALQLCDVTSFLAASDAKQIEAILALIPGDEAGRIRELGQNEENLKQNLNNATAKLRGLESSLASLIEARATLPSASATLPEIQDELSRLTQELGLIDRQIGAEKERIEAQNKAAMSSIKAEEGKAEYVTFVDQDPLGIGDVKAGLDEEQGHGVALPLSKSEAARQDLVNMYGYCPFCGAPGVYREDRPNGNDTCRNGHRYPSNDAKKSIIDALGTKITKTVGPNTMSFSDLKPGDRFSFEDGAEASPVPTRQQATGWHPQGFVKVGDLKKVIEAMDKAGCGACAAKMLLKKLIKEAM